MRETRTGIGVQLRSLRSSWWVLPAVRARPAREDEPRLFRGILYGLLLSGLFFAAILIGLFVWLR